MCVYVCVCRALVGHPDDNINHLSLEDTGAGGLEELLDRLMDTKAQYALGTPTHNNHTPYMDRPHPLYKMEAPSCML